MVLIKLRSTSFKFDLEFHSKFSFILGNSGDRKTHFVSLCAKLRKGYKSVNGNIKINGVNLRKEEINVLSKESAQVDYERLLLTQHNCLFVIDEFSEIFHYRELSSWLKKSDNYFIFITRKLSGYLPVNVQSVYLFERSGNQIVNVPKYHKFDHMDFSHTEYILTEDSVSGRQFFKKNFKNIEVCESTAMLNGKKASRDNSQLHAFLEEDLKTKNNILVVYDSAAYAPFYESLVDVLSQAKAMCKTVKVLDWESFEHYILSLPMFGENYDLDATGCKFNSLEQMCKDRLSTLINYQKDSLPPCFDRYNDCSECKSLKNCKFAAKRSKREIVVGRLRTLQKDNKAITTNAMSLF